MAVKRDSGRRKESGVILVALAVLAAALFGAAALAIDAGRVFVNRNEAQTFADSAALAAAMELDGTRAGLIAARAAAGKNENRWDFGARRFDPPLVEFARYDAPGAWERDPPDPKNYTRVRVTVRLQQTLLFAPIVGDPLRRVIGAVAVAAAAQVPLGSFRQGLWPFAVEHPVEPGERRAAREWWGAPGADRILTDGHPPGGIVALGQLLTPRGAPPEDAAPLIRKRILQDTDPEAATYGEYLERGQGNGRRVVAAPVLEDGVVKAFGMFFLPADGATVEYVGRAWVRNSARPGAGPPGVYAIRLVEEAE